MVSHESRIDVAQARQVDDKPSEITVMREFLKETGLEKANISLDAHHGNPETMTQIGRYKAEIEIEKSHVFFAVQKKEQETIF